MRMVRVIWEGPLSFEEVLKLDDNENDFGVYQVYGDHVVFGPGSLLYIGLAQRQSFSTRFQQHLPWLKEEPEIRIHVGRIAESDYKEESDWKDWESLIADVEALLIWWHTPPYNSRNIISYTGQHLHIQNWGNPGMLLPECSSHWGKLRPSD